MEFKVGDKVRLKPIPPPIGEVITVHFNDQITVRWPSGMESLITRPNEIEKVEE
jgi:hypothetical protein